MPEIKFGVQDINGKFHPVNLDRYPDLCPICHMSGEQKLITGYYTRINGKPFLQIVFVCPIYKCQKLIIAYYLHDKMVHGENCFLYKHSLPIEPDPVEFSDIVKKLSPEFCTIYNQAKTAEFLNLKHVAGCGYRKSLEFLIKDYAIIKHPLEKSEITKMFLSDCIKNYIENETIKKTAKLATWLGNDEAHYYRKWAKNINDLKKLINLTTHWIDLVELTQKYETNMSKENKR